MTTLGGESGRERGEAIPIPNGTEFRTGKKREIAIIKKVSAGIRRGEGAHFGLWS